MADVRVRRPVRHRELFVPKSAMPLRWFGCFAENGRGVAGERLPNALRDLVQRCTYGCLYLLCNSAL